MNEDDLSRVDLPALSTGQDLPRKPHPEICHRNGKRGDRVFTPRWCASDIVEHFKPCGRVLEPFRGGGVFMDYLPKHAEWCEIDDRRNFFQWDEKVDWVVSNPPYSLTRESFRHARHIADHVVFLVPLRNVTSGYGFVRELLRDGGIPEIRLYGTGSALGFPMGNCVAAVYWKRWYTGPTTWTDYHDDVASRSVLFGANTCADAG